MQTPNQQCFSGLLNWKDHSPPYREDSIPETHLAAAIAEPIGSPVKEEGPY